MNRITRKRDKKGNFKPEGRKPGTAILTIADLIFLEKYNLLEHIKEGDIKHGNRSN